MHCSRRTRNRGRALASGTAIVENIGGNARLVGGAVHSYIPRALAPHASAAPTFWPAVTDSIQQLLDAVPSRPRRAPEPVDIGLRELIAIREIVHAFLTADRP